MTDLSFDVWLRVMNLLIFLTLPSFIVAAKRKDQGTGEAVVCDRARRGALAAAGRRTGGAIVRSRHAQLHLLFNQIQRYRAITVRHK